jgi:hypothetical protein
LAFPAGVGPSPPAGHDGPRAAGLLDGDTAPYHTARGMAFTAAGGGDQSGTPALTPVPQELIATIEARFRTTDVSLPDA